MTKSKPKEVPAEETPVLTPIVVQDKSTAAMMTNFPSMDYIEEYEAFLNNYDKFVNRMLKEDVDYGTIPGVAKPTLLKPGAEKLEKLFTLRHEKECIEKDIAAKYTFVKYTYRTSIYNKQGQLVATCEGSCNSHEKKYRSITVFDNQATEEQKKTGKLETRTSKAGNPYNVYVLDKPDFYDMENTIMKMAQKRSYVGAILEATNSSSRFTQDVEDMEIAEDKKVPSTGSTAMDKFNAELVSDQNNAPGAQSITGLK